MQEVTLFIEHLDGEVSVDKNNEIYISNGHAPKGLIEGIVDIVRLKVNYAPSNWVQGDRWHQGFNVTAKFLDYCNSLRNDFVAELNKKMRSGLQ
ncbi:hypothetical protein Q3G72_002555 [Acer saccharum]|nr:hypothetical protein Q3G72_002555 [Acer saccharum]